MADLLKWTVTKDGEHCAHRSYRLWDDRGRVVGHAFHVRSCVGDFGIKLFTARSQVTRDGAKFGALQLETFFETEEEAKAFMETRAPVLEESCLRKKQFTNYPVPAKARRVERHPRGLQDRCAGRV